MAIRPKYIKWFEVYIGAYTSFL